MKRQRLYIICMKSAAVDAAGLSTESVGIMAWEIASRLASITAATCISLNWHVSRGYVNVPLCMQSLAGW